MASVFTLATNGSPSVSTWVANATSQYYIVNAKDNSRPAPCSFDVTGTWNSASLALEQCNAPGDSPQPRAKKWPFLGHFGWYAACSYNEARCRHDSGKPSSSHRRSPSAYRP